MIIARLKIIPRTDGKDMGSWGLALMFSILNFCSIQSIGVDHAQFFLCGNYSALPKIFQLTFFCQSSLCMPQQFCVKGSIMVKDDMIPCKHKEGKSVPSRILAPNSHILYYCSQWDVEHTVYVWGAWWSSLNHKHLVVTIQQKGRRLRCSCSEKASNEHMYYIPYVRTSLPPSQSYS